jgi:hypothetical protein
MSNEVSGSATHDNEGEQQTREKDAERHKHKKDVKQDTIDAVRWRWIENST